MNGLIETLGEDDDDRVVLYLRHFWVTAHGPTKERELAAAIKREISNETKTLQFVLTYFATRQMIIFGLVTSSSQVVGWLQTINSQIDPYNFRPS